MKHLYKGIVEYVVIRGHLMSVGSFLFEILPFPTETKTLAWPVLWDISGKIKSVYWKDSTPPFLGNAHTFSSKAYNQLARHSLHSSHTVQMLMV